jgi:molecular chaperone HtpG
LVADNVTVISKSYSDDTAHRWTSSAGGTFTINPETETDIKRGTMIVL